MCCRRKRCRKRQTAHRSSLQASSELGRHFQLQLLYSVYAIPNLGLQQQDGFFSLSSAPSCTPLNIFFPTCLLPRLYTSIHVLTKPERSSSTLRALLAAEKRRPLNQRAKTKFISCISKCRKSKSKLSFLELKNTYRFIQMICSHLSGGTWVCPFEDPKKQK